MPEKVFNPRNTPIPVPCPPPLFHGTDASLRPGDVVLSGLAVKRSHSPWVYLADDPGYCSGYAYYRSEGDGHVYEVEPIGEVQACRSNYRARSARVIREVEQP